MVGVLDRPAAATPSGNRRRWRRAAIIAGSVVLVAAVGVGIGFWRYAATYSPLQAGPFFGPYHDSSGVFVRRATDLGDEVYVRGHAGTEARTIFTIENHGTFDVTIDGIQKSPLLPGVEWSPYILRPGGNAYGKQLPLRRFPAVVTSHQNIRVVVTLRKPLCSPGLGIIVSTVIVHWHALGASHESELPFALGATFVGCPQHAR